MPSDTSNLLTRIVPGLKWFSSACRFSCVSLCIRSEVQGVPGRPFRHSATVSSGTMIRPTGAPHAVCRLAYLLLTGIKWDQS
eukprot:6276085-Amphidinium_carterae.1